MNKIIRLPGFTYIETLASITCIIVFIIGIQQYAHFYVLHKKTIDIHNELNQLALYLSEQLREGIDYTSLNDRFINTPNQYQNFTSDAYMIPPVSVLDAETVYGVQIPDFYLDRGINVILSREKIVVHGSEYWAYHCIVYLDEFYDTIKKCSMYCIEC